MRKYKEITEFVIDLFKIFSILGTAIGAFIVVIYCIEIQFFPQGVTISGALLFIWVTINFGILYGLIIVMLYMANLSIFYLLCFIRQTFLIVKFKKTEIKNLKIKYLPPVDIMLIFFLYGLIAQALIILFSIDLKIFSLMKIILVQTLMLLLYFIKFCADNRIKSKCFKIVNIKKEESDKDKISRNFMYLLLLILIPLVIGQFGGNLIKFSFTLSGIRQSNVTLYIDNNYRNVLQTRINQFNDGKEKSLHLKSIPECIDLCHLDNVNILFANVGSQILFEIRTMKDKNGQSEALRFNLPSSAIKGIDSKFIYSKDD
ncbi:hypothetical protein [Snodgrassella alvi]|jgi:hypothetical protein|uniref:Uncharacterized protein n=1 Tax=Snodgrassella alvi TaxID=1196083 RepID=A0A855FQV5_9NEIS|nr:hypothetical protein [Snodgrassella alvi]PIT60860.1 hypothetical protein BHC57_03340 [Snodgrassella alvi]